MGGLQPAIGEEVLVGGSMGGAVRVGDTVRRGAGPWSSSVQRLLRHLRERGLTRVPEPLGTDARGRDVVRHLPGTVPRYPLPEVVWSDDVLVDAARHLLELHRASASFDPSGAIWQLPVHEPVEVVCHNHFAPHNTVFTGGRLTGVIDSGHGVTRSTRVGPGPSCPPARAADPQADGDTVGDTGERARRLRLLCDAYGGGSGAADVLPVAVDRLHEVAAFTAARADEGRGHLRSHVALYRRDAGWVAAHAGQLGHEAD